MTKTTVYLSSDSQTFNLRAFTGAIEHAAMWNTITNVLRMANVMLECYYCVDDGYYIDSEGYYYRVK